MGHLSSTSSSPSGLRRVSMLSTRGIKHWQQRLDGVGRGCCSNKTCASPRVGSTRLKLLREAPEHLKSRICMFLKRWNGSDIHVQFYSSILMQRQHHSRQRPARAYTNYAPASRLYLCAAAHAEPCAPGITCRISTPQMRLENTAVYARGSPHGPSKNFSTVGVVAPLEWDML